MERCIFCKSEETGGGGIILGDNPARHGWKYEIKGSPKTRVKTRGTIWNWNVKDNFMARYWHNCTFLEGASFE